MKNKEYSRLFKEYRKAVALHNDYFDLYINKKDQCARKCFIELSFKLRNYKVELCRANTKYQASI